MRGAEVMNSQNWALQASSTDHRTKASRCAWTSSSPRASNQSMQFGWMSCGCMELPGPFTAGQIVGWRNLAARRDRLRLFPEPELGIVFAAFALAYDDGTFGLSFVGLDARVVHMIGLDRQGQVDLWRGQRLEIRRAIGPGEGVQRAATPRYLFAALAVPKRLPPLKSTCSTQREAPVLP